MTEPVEGEPPAGRRRRRLAWPLVVVAVAGGAVLVVVLSRRRRQSTGDLGGMLLDLVAEAGDVLSAYQDALVEESRLPSGRRRRGITLEFGDGARGARPRAGTLKLVARYGAGDRGHLDYLKVWDRRVSAAGLPMSGRRPAAVPTPPGAAGRPRQAPGRGGFGTQPASRPR